MVSQDSHNVQENRRTVQRKRAKCTRLHLHASRWRRGNRHLLLKVVLVAPARRDGQSHPRDKPTVLSKPRIQWGVLVRQQFLQCGGWVMSSEELHSILSFSMQEMAMAGSHLETESNV